MNLSINLAQMKIVQGDFRGNTSRALGFIERASHSGADIIVFPELWTAGFDYSDCRAYAQQNSQFLETIQTVSDRMGIAIGGSYLVEINQQYYNQFVLSQPGLPRLTYEKIHLFHLMEEDAHLSPGKHVSVFSSRWGRLGFAVCYDVRFPEMFRLAREDGAMLMIMAAGWPLKRIAHWKTLVKARAIENQCFFAAVNCVGGDDNLPFGGSSMVIGPWGEEIAAGDEQEEALVSAAFDLEEASGVRARYPFFEDRLRNYSLATNHQGDSADLKSLEE
jgi:predicted amidohydrolase